MWFERDQTFTTISQFDDGVFRVVNEVLVNSFFKHARVSTEMLYQGSDRKSINTYDTFMLISFTVGLYIHTRILFWLRTLTKIKRIQNIIPSSDDLSSPFLKRFWNHRVPINGYYYNAKKNITWVKKWANLLWLQFMYSRPQVTELPLELTQLSSFPVNIVI